MQNAVVEHKVGIIQQLCSILRPILAMLLIFYDINASIKF